MHIFGNDLYSNLGLSLPDTHSTVAQVLNKYLLVKNNYPVKSNHESLSSIYRSDSCRHVRPERGQKR